MEESSNVLNKHSDKELFSIFAQVLQEEASIRELIPLMPDLKFRSSLIAFSDFKERMETVDEAINMKVIPDKALNEEETARLYRILLARNYKKISESLMDMSKCLAVFIASMMKVDHRIVVMMDFVNIFKALVDSALDTINKIEVDMLKIIQSPLEDDQVLEVASDIFSSWQQMKLALNHRIVYAFEHAIKYWAQLELSQKMYGGRI